jgi:hypothetical protein
MLCSRDTDSDMPQVRKSQCQHSCEKGANICIGGGDKGGGTCVIVWLDVDESAANLGDGARVGGLVSMKFHGPPLGQQRTPLLFLSSVS